MDEQQTGLSRRSKWLLGLLTPVVLVVGGGVWLTSTTSGLQWLADVVAQNAGKQFSASGISGSLLDIPGMQKLTLRGEGWRVQMWDVQMQWQPSRLLSGKLDVLNLSVRQIDILTSPSDEPGTMPASIKLPIKVDLLKLNVGTLRLFSQEGAAPDFTANDITASFNSDAQRHKVQLQQAKTGIGDIVFSAEMGTARPFPLQADAVLDAPLEIGTHHETLHITVEAKGDLNAIAVKANGKDGNFSARATAQLTPYAQPNLHAVHVDFGGLDADWLLADGHKAMLSGVADLHGKKGGALQGELKLRNESAALPFDQKGLPVSEVSANFELSAGHFKLDTFNARLPNDGQITGSLTWQLRSKKGDAHLHLKEVDPVALDTRLPHSHLQGDITLEGSQAEQQALLALTDGQVKLDGEFTHQGSQIEVSKLRLLRGDTEISGHGQLALDRRRTFNLSSRVARLNLAEVMDAPKTDLNAKLEVMGTLLPQAAGELRFDLANSRFAQYDIGGKGRLSLSDSRQFSGEAEAHLGINKLQLKAVQGSAADFLHIRLDAPDLSQFGDGLAGQLNAQAELSGSIDDPVLNFILSGNKLQLPVGRHIERLNATGRLRETEMRMQLGMADIYLPGGLSIPLVNIELEGDRAQHRIAATVHAEKGKESLAELALVAHGGFNENWRDGKSLQWQGALDTLDATGIMPAHLLFAAPLQISKDNVHLGAAEIALGDGRLSLLESSWTPQDWHSAGSFSGIGVQAVSANHRPLLLSRMDTLRFGGAWDMAGNEHLSGEMSVQREGGDWKLDEQGGSQIGLRKLRFTLKAEQDSLSSDFEAEGEHLGEISVQTVMPLTHDDAGWTVLPDAPLSGHVHLDAKDFSWIAPMVDDNLQSGGALVMDADIAGSMLVPRLQGVALGNDLRIALLDQGVSLERGKLYVLFDRDVVHVEQLSFVAPYQDKPRDKRLEDFELEGDAGHLNASGTLDLQGRNGDLKFTAEHLPLSQREDRWIIASADGQIRFADKTFMLDANVVADAGLIDQPVSNRPRWSEDMKVVGEEPVQKSSRQTKVNASLDLGEHFFIRASGLEGRLEGTLDVRGEPGQPLNVTGIIEAQDAVFDAYGQRLKVERGMVNFQGQMDDPGLNILALRKGLSVEAGVEVEGTARHPIVHLVSTPNVPDAEKLSWIMLGRVPDSAGLDTSLLLAAAGNILGGQSTGQIGRSLGVDEFSMRQSGSGDALTSQTVTVGKRISSRAYLSYEQGFAATSGVTKFSYTLTPRVTLVTRTGAEDAMDIFYSFRYR